MSHRQHDPFYTGARYEYATILSLSAFASVVQVPRPEDYGFDLLCTLVELENRNRYARISFGVQTKPQSEKVLNYGGEDKGIQKDWEVEWLFGRDLPLLISTVDFNPFCIRLYSTWNVWHAYLSDPVNLVREVSLHIGKQPPNDAKDRWKSYGGQPHRDVYLGSPIIEMSTPVPTNDEAATLRKCIDFWLNLDMINLLYRKLGIPWMYTVWEWETNQVPALSEISFTFWDIIQGDFSVRRRNLLLTLAPMIKALQLDFQANGETKNAERLRGIIEILEPLGFVKF